MRLTQMTAISALEKMYESPTWHIYQVTLENWKQFTVIWKYWVFTRLVHVEKEWKNWVKVIKMDKQPLLNSTSENSFFLTKVSQIRTDDQEVKKYVEKFVRI